MKGGRTMRRKDYNSFVKDRLFAGYNLDFIDKNIERTHEYTRDEFCVYTVWHRFENIE